MSERVYLDNAATSWPKPESVYAAVERYQRQIGAPAGRSAYAEAAEVERAVRDARKQIAQLIHAEGVEQIVFTFNGTDSLNQAIHGIVRPGDRVVTTVLEHNSVARPFRYLEREQDVEVIRVPCDSETRIDPAVVGQSLRAGTRLLVVNHASNVSGALQEVAEIVRQARELGICVLVDAAQSLGHVPIDVRDWGIDLLAAPGHKGLLGPLGTGVLYISSRIAEQMRPIRQGGTGTNSQNDQQPDSMPDRFESGNHNVPGIVGLRAGTAFVADRGVDTIRRHEMALTVQLMDGLAPIPGVRVLGPRSAAHRVGVVSITVEGYDPQEFATILDVVHSIQVRSGLHCAPGVHAALGTLDRGGTIRFSLGPFNTAQDIESTVLAVREFAGSG